MPTLDLLIKARDQASGALNKVAKSIGDTAQAAQGASAAMAAAGASIVGVFGAAVATTKAYGEQVDKIAKTSGVSTTAIQKLGFAAEQEHASIEALSGGLNKLSRSLLDAAKGGESAATFRQLGISVTDASGKIRQADAVLLDLADRFKTLPNGPLKTALAMKIFGRSGAELVPFLSQGRAEIQRLGEEAERLGIVMSQQDVAAAEQFGDALSSLQQAIKGLSLTLGTALIPALTSIVVAITNVVAGIGAWTKAHPTLTQFIIGFVGTLGVLLTIIGSIGLVIGPLIAGFTAIGTVLGGVGIVVGGVAAALTGLAAIITGPVAIAIAAIVAGAVLVIKYWEPIKFFFIGLWETIKEVFASIAEWIRAKVAFIGEVIDGLMKKIENIPGASAILGVVPGFGGGLQTAFNARQAAVQGAGVQITGANVTRGQVVIQTRGTPISRAEFEDQMNRIFRVIGFGR